MILALEELVSKFLVNFFPLIFVASCSTHVRVGVS